MRNIDLDAAQVVIDFFDKNKSRDDFQELVQISTKLPTYILVNGLASTLAFLINKNKTIVTPFIKWLSVFIKIDVKSGPKDVGLHFLKKIVTLDMNKYRKCTIRSLRLAEWFKRIGKIYTIEEKSSNE